MEAGDSPPSPPASRPTLPTIVTSFDTPATPRPPVPPPSEISPPPSASSNAHLTVPGSSTPTSTTPDDVAPPTAPAAAAATTTLSSSSPASLLRSTPPVDVASSFPAPPAPTAPRSYIATPSHRSTLSTPHTPPSNNAMAPTAMSTPTTTPPSLSRKLAHTRASPSIATMGSVLSEDGSQSHPILVDFEDDPTHDAVITPASISGPRTQRSTSFGGDSVSASASDTLPAPSTNGLIGSDEKDVLPVPSSSTHAKRTSWWSPLLFWKHSSPQDENDEKTPPGAEDEATARDPMEAAREAARTAVALPDPSEADMAPFKASPRTMNALIDPKSIANLEAMGGTAGLVAGLHTHAKMGLVAPGSRDSDPHWDKRLGLYGTNRVPERPQKSLLALMWAALKDKVLVLLMIAAVVSLALGLYTTFGTEPKTYTDENGKTITEPRVDWVEGVAILVAVAIVTVVGSINDYQKERQFRTLNAQKEDRNVKVIRAGIETMINVHDLVVGDVALVEPGEIIPADGVVLEGFGIKCDESGATGESDAVKKMTYDDWQSKRKALTAMATSSSSSARAADIKADCFMISGSKVLEGYGKYVVTAVGKYSFFGKIMMSLRGDTESTPLQLKLNRLAELIAKLGASAGGLLFVVLLIKFFVQLKTNPGRSAGDKAQAFTQVLIIAVTVVVVAVPEGLPLAVTLALAFATRRMTKMNLLVRVLGACETMANATVVCTDKTGTLTTNTMTVVAGSIGVHLKFASQLDENEDRINANDDLEGIDDVVDDQDDKMGTIGSAAGTGAGVGQRLVGGARSDASVISEKVEPRQGRLDFSMDMDAISNALSEPLRQLFNDSIAINSTAFEESSSSSSSTTTTTSTPDAPTSPHGGDVGVTVGGNKFVGSKTETALLAFAQHQGWEHYKTIRDGARIVQMIPFSSERKAMGVVIQLPNGRYRLLIKGASEVLTRFATRYVYVANPQGDARANDEETKTTSGTYNNDQTGEQVGGHDGATKTKKVVRDGETRGEEEEEEAEEEEETNEEVQTALFDHETRGNISRTIIFYANLSLRTLALCYRDFTSWPPPGAPLVDSSRDEGDASSTLDPGASISIDGGSSSSSNEEVEYKWLVKDLTLLAVVGIEDPLRPGVTDAVATCAGAGVAVKMVTGDNIITAKSIATQCGIYTPGGIIMEGPVFRKLSEREMWQVCPRLQVLARSSPEDKKLLVEHLKARGEVVGVTGDGTNDGPALKTANVGFSMGIAGTEVAKEASDIILMDDNFASIVSAIMWGRCVNDSVKKFLQFQISVNITAVIVTFVTATASSSESSVLTAVQLLWVNLIMDTFAALALATDPATLESLKRQPDAKMADLVTVDMWKMIVAQSIFQLIAVLTLNFGGKQILGMGDSVRDDDELKTLVFNTFVFCQIFNQLNARVLDRRLNVFAGFWRNYYFMVIMAIMIGGQILIVFVGGAAFQVKHISARDWGISIVIGALSLPLGVMVKLIPTEPIARFCYDWGFLQDPQQLKADQVDLEEPEEEERYIEAIERVRDSLATFGQLRGGRLRSSSFVSRSRAKAQAMIKKRHGGGGEGNAEAGRGRRRGRGDVDEVHPGALMTMVPTLVMSSIAAGWQPIPRPSGSLSDPAGELPSKATTQLWTSKYEVHPDTNSSDPVMQRFMDGTYRTPRSRSGSTATFATASSHSRYSLSGGIGGGGAVAGPSASPRIASNTLSVPPSPVR